jgi:hypothetical protein
MPRTPILFNQKYTLGLEDLFLYGKSYLTRILKVTIVYFHSYNGTWIK